MNFTARAGIFLPRACVGWLAQATKGTVRYGSGHRHVAAPRAWGGAARERAHPAVSSQRQLISPPAKAHRLWLFATSGCIRWGQMCNRLQAWLTINALGLCARALVTASASLDACYVYVTGPGTTQSLNKKKFHPTSPTAYTGDPPYEHHRRPTACTHMRSIASNGASPWSRRSAHLLEK